MTKWCLDTNIYVAFKRNQGDVVEAFRRVDVFGVDVAVLAELYAGFRMGSRETQNRKDLHRFMESPRAQLLLHDELTAEYYALVVKQLRDKGKPIPANDIWIAANALRFGMPLLTRDIHFSVIDGLMLVSL